MVDPSQIRHLLKLVEDRSQKVRDMAIEGLLAYGPELEAHIQTSDITLTSRQMRAIEWVRAIKAEEAVWYKAWREFPHIGDELLRLERGLEVLAWFLYGWRPPEGLTERLDELVHRFTNSGHATDDPVALSTFLFGSNMFTTNPNAPNNPQYANLLHVVRTGEGGPLALTCLFILLGGRLGIQARGWNVSTRVLVRSEVGGHNLFLDCAEGGRVLTTDELQAPHESGVVCGTLVSDEPLSDLGIIRGLLQFVRQCYRSMQDFEGQRMAGRLLDTLP